MTKVMNIEIDFDEAVELTEDDQKALVEIAGRISDRYKKANPGRTMWPFGIGTKIKSNLFMLDDDDPIEYDEDTFHIDCHEREDFKWPCAKCEHEQGNHKGLILDPPAGDCDYEPKTFN